MSGDPGYQSLERLLHWGDTLLAVAALFPERLTFVCDEGVHSALLTELDLRQVVETRMTRNIPDWTREFSASDVAAQIETCDLFISLAPWHSRSLGELTAHLRPEASVGFFDDFSLKIPLNFNQRAADLMFDIPTASMPRFGWRTTQCRRSWT